MDGFFKSRFRHLAMKKWTTCYKPLQTWWIIYFYIGISWWWPQNFSFSSFPLSFFTIYGNDHLDLGLRISQPANWTEATATNNEITCQPPVSSHRSHVLSQFFNKKYENIIRIDQSRQFSSFTYQTFQPVNLGGRFEEPHSTPPSGCFANCNQIWRLV